MPGVTAGGLPYPEDHDPLADIAQAVQNLAEAVDTVIAQRPRSVVVTGSYSPNASGEVVIAHGLPSAPRYAHIAVEHSGLIVSLPGSGISGTNVTGIVRTISNGAAVTSGTHTYRLLAVL